MGMLNCKRLNEESSEAATSKEMLNCKRFNEESSEESSEAASPKGICRLRYGLNTSCLLKVFDYLSVYDLIQVCKLDIYFKELIIKWIIGKKGLDLTGELSWSSNTFLELFETFGKSIRKFNTGALSLRFTTVFQNIIKYCEPASFTELLLDIEYEEDNKAIDRNLMQLSMPFFSNLRKFIFEKSAFQEQDMFTEFLMQISISAPIQILELRDIEINGGWLKNMQNLCELRITCNIHMSISECSHSFEDLTSFWMANTKIKVLKFTGHQDITTIGAALSKYCSQLEEFGYINLKNPYNRFGAPMIHRYDFLSTFSNLHPVTLTSHTFCGSDLYYPLVALATKKIVELRVLMDYSWPIILHEEEKAKIMRSPIPHFLSLQTVEIQIYDGCSPSGDYRISDVIIEMPRFDVRCKFMFHFMSQLKNLQHFRIASFGLCRIYRLLEFVPNIRTLDISQVDFIYSDEILNIGQTLRKMRKANDGRKDHHLLHLILRNWINYDDMKDILTVTIRKYKQYGTCERDYWGPNKDQLLE